MLLLANEGAFPENCPGVVTRRLPSKLLVETQPRREDVLPHCETKIDNKLLHRTSIIHNSQGEILLPPDTEHKLDLQQCFARLVGGLASTLAYNSHGTAGQ